MLVERAGGLLRGQVGKIDTCHRDSGEDPTGKKQFVTASDQANNR
jgi:hypothetical protein